MNKLPPPNRLPHTEKTPENRSIGARISGVSAAIRRTMIEEGGIITAGIYLTIAGGAYWMGNAMENAFKEERIRKANYSAEDPHYQPPTKLTKPATVEEIPKKMQASVEASIQEKS